MQESKQGLKVWLGWVVSIVSCIVAHLQQDNVGLGYTPCVRGILVALFLAWRSVLHAIAAALKDLNIIICIVESHEEIHVEECGAPCMTCFCFMKKVWDVSDLQFSSALEVSLAAVSAG